MHVTWISMLGDPDSGVFATSGDVGEPPPRISGPHMWCATHCRAQYELLGESEIPVFSSFTTSNYREYFQTAKGGIVELHLIHEGPGPLAELCWPRDRLPFPWMSSCAAVPRSRMSWLKFSTRGIEVPSPPTPVPR